MHRFIDGVGRHGNVYMSDEDEVAFLDALRQRAARLFHTETEQIAILSSASELLGQLPFMLPPPLEAKVVVVATDFPAVTRPWLRLVEHGGCRLEFVDDNPTSDLTSDLIARIDEHTSVVAVSSVQYATGTVIDVPRLRVATAEVGARLVIDHRCDAGRRCNRDQHRRLARRCRGIQRIQVARWSRRGCNRRAHTRDTRTDPTAARMDGRSGPIRVRRHANAVRHRCPPVYAIDNVVCFGCRPRHGHGSAIDYRNREDRASRCAACPRADRRCRTPWLASFPPPR